MPFVLVHAVGWHCSHWPGPAHIKYCNVPPYDTPFYKLSRPFWSRYLLESMLFYFNQFSIIFISLLAPPGKFSWCMVMCYRLVRAWVAIVASARVNVMVITPSVCEFTRWSKKILKTRVRDSVFVSNYWIVPSAFNEAKLNIIFQINDVCTTQTTNF